GVRAHPSGWRGSGGGAVMGDLHPATASALAELAQWRREGDVDDPRIDSIAVVFGDLIRSHDDARRVAAAILGAVDVQQNELRAHALSMYDALNRCDAEQACTESMALAILTVGDPTSRTEVRTAVEALCDY